MPLIHFEKQDGSRHDVEADEGVSVMRAAVDNDVQGIVGDCGGHLQCATCHVYVDEAWIDRLPIPSEDETEMIEGAYDVRTNSRLSCQITLADSLSGLVVRVPVAQI